MGLLMIVIDMYSTYTRLSALTPLTRFATISS